jgi:hypothetical protein
MSGDAFGAWPRLIGGQVSLSGGAFPPGAIRIHKARATTDAELLVPVADAEPGQGSQRDTVTWMVEATGWEKGVLPLAIRSLAQQRGGNSDYLTFIGPVDSISLSLADELFGGRVAAFEDMRRAVANPQTPLVGFIGSDVLLHDVRTAELLSVLLDCDRVSTSTCALIHVERRGKGWHTAAVDAGLLIGKGEGALDGPDDRPVVQQLWRSHFPVAAPPSKLWLTRAQNLRGWADEAGALSRAADFHLCSFVVSASYVGKNGFRQREPFVPHAPAGHAMKLELHVG